MTVSFTRSARRIFGVGVLTFTVAATGGCSDDQPVSTFTPRAVASSANPEGSETNEPSPGPTEDDQLIAPTLPVFSDDPIKAAEQRLEHFIEVYEYGYFASDPEPLEKISHPECGTCKLHIDRMMERQTTGEYSEGGGLELKEIEIFPIDDDQSLAVVVMHQEDRTSYYKNGTVKESGEAVDISLSFLTAHVNDQWRIRAIGGGDDS